MAFRSVGSMHMSRMLCMSLTAHRHLAPGTTVYSSPMLPGMTLSDKFFRYDRAVYVVSELDPELGTVSGKLIEGCDARRHSSLT